MKCSFLLLILFQISVSICFLESTCDERINEQVCTAECDCCFCPSNSICYNKYDIGNITCEKEWIHASNCPSTFWFMIFFLAFIVISISLILCIILLGFKENKNCCVKK